MQKPSTLFLLTLLLPCTFAGYAVPPVADVELSAAPAARLGPVLDVFLQSQSFSNSFGPVFSYYNSSLFSKLPQSYFDVVAAAILTHWPDYAAELQGLASAFQAHGYYVTYQYLAAWAYFHELSHIGSFAPYQRECTGVVARSGSGTVTQGRNMDQVPSQARNLDMHVRYTKHGVVMFEAVDWYWFCAGFVTGFLKGVVSVQENWRVLSVSGDTVLSLIKAGVVAQSWLFREAFTSGITTFDSFVAYINTAPLASPMYAIVAGAGQNEGAIVTRNVTGYFPVIYLNATTPDYFLVQTNYDHWLPDVDGRRTAAEKFLRALGQDLGSSSAGVLAVMATPPQGNDATLYTAIMCPVTNYFLPLYHVQP